MRSWFAARQAAWGVALLGLLLAGCGGVARPSVSGGGVTGQVSVFAASSLTDTFRALGTAFRQAHPGVTVVFNFGASSALATQIEQGAPADVFAAADSANMQRLADRRLIAGASVPFARNVPVLIVPAENRAAIRSPRDLAVPGGKIVLAGPEVPVGRYAREVIDRLAAGPYGAAYRDAVLRNVVSNEANVRAVLSKVELGEADAGIVYRTDAMLSGSRVTIVPLPPEANVFATYPIAVTRDARNPSAARAFIEFVRGAEGQRIMSAAGFDAAP